MLWKKFEWIKRKVDSLDRECFGHVEAMIKRELGSIAGWDRKEEVQEITIEEVLQRKASKTRSEVLLRMEEIKWTQKSREIDVKERGHNTFYFHKLPNVRARYNFLAKLNRDGGAGGRRRATY